MAFFAILVPRRWAIALIPVLFLFPTFPLFPQAPTLLTMAEHPDLEKAAQWREEAWELSNEGNYHQAITKLEQVLALQQGILGQNHPVVLETLRLLADIYLAQGEDREHNRIYGQVLEMRVKLAGESEDAIAHLRYLASFYTDPLFDYPQSRATLHQALQMAHRLHSADHPIIGDLLHELGQLYRFHGRLAEGADFHQQALAHRKRVLGDNHLQVAQSLADLALLAALQDHHPQAITLAQQALTIQQEQLDPADPDIWRTKELLARFYREQGQYETAESLLQTVLNQKNRHHPPDTEESVTTAYTLQNLGDLLAQQGQYETAENYYTQALAIFHRWQQSDLQSVAEISQALGHIAEARGDYNQAESLYLDHLAYFQKWGYAGNFLVAQALSNLASFKLQQGEITPALDYLHQSLADQEIIIERVLPLLGESEKQNYMNRFSATTNQAISLHLQNAPNNLNAAQLALTTIFRRKGRVLDALTDNLQTFKAHLTPPHQQLLDELINQRAKLAELRFNPPTHLTPEGYKDHLRELQNKIEVMESQLARISANLRTETTPVTLEQIQEKIPPDAVLVEFIVYRPHRRPSPDQLVWGEPHYAAYILAASGEPQWVNLGKTAPIDQAVAEFRRALTLGKARPMSRQYREKGRQLDTLLMQPIRAKITQISGDITHLLLSPDGQLNLIPFAALVDENNQLLLKNYRITYLTTGRDLLRQGATPPSQNPAIILANPDYGEVEEMAIPSNRGLRDLNVLPLPNTATEAELVSQKLENVKVFMDKLATETVVKQVQSPQILHLATHGFFLPDIEAILPSQFLPNSEDSAPLVLENPLLRSGLALAGFNQRSSGEEDGVLTALEVANLDLQGTQLVVLSACETGVGEITNGEGVYGLRRALVIAGAESQVISLWSVDDAGTKDLMVRYYEKLLQGEGRSEALRLVQLALAEGEVYQHPFYWAAFIPSGDWGVMK
ncbi:CHAT domain-containing tetratricopeptide repeat protein [Spirulina subsalsa]|uniref:CHAT domain-containing tetratricopeptide repeat protein n=1 Tax=Spirulina subsalsa TaxID=54311 RepID=UPI000313DEC1|nr:CHAT domain-containing tetratricopeptide repeat protein [Spirulina subsalsa]